MITITPYNDRWPSLFREEATLIQNKLGNQCVAIHHVGSTAVSGLCAKPIIDIILEVSDKGGMENDDNYQQLITKLQSLNYVYKGEYNIPGRLYFNNDHVNLHVYPQDHPEIDLNLLFRDQLRQHDDLRDGYAQLKLLLLQDNHNHHKNELGFTGYNLGKHDFIQKILAHAGYDCLRMVKSLHYKEWDAVNHFRQHYFFDQVLMADPYVWTFHHPDHVHLVLYKGVTIIGYAHIQLWPQHRAALRIIVIEEDERCQHYGGQFLTLIEQWLYYCGFHSVHTESRADSEKFYRHHGYTDMNFNDPEDHKSNNNDMQMGKNLKN